VAAVRSLRLRDGAAAANAGSTPGT